MSSTVERGAGRFRRKPKEVEAVLHKGDVEATFEAMRAFGWMRLGGFVGLANDAIEVEDGPNQLGFVAHAGDWIVLSPDARFFRIDAGSFAIEYEPVEQDGEHP